MIFWLCVLLIFLLLAAISETEEHETRGTVITVVFLAINAVYYLWFRSQFLAFYTSLQWSYLIYFGVYVVAGLIFSFYKWFRFTKWYITSQKSVSWNSGLSQEVLNLRLEDYLVVSSRTYKVA